MKVYFCSVVLARYNCIQILFHDEIINIPGDSKRDKVCILREGPV
jgi:hypothetical protein